MASQATSAMLSALQSCRAQYQKIIDRAEHILEARRVEHYQTIERSASKVAEIQGHLEFMEHMERERDAARLRTELHEADLDHRATVDSANRVLANALRDYAKAHSAAGAALEAALNSELAKLELP